MNCETVMLPPDHRAPTPIVSIIIINWNKSALTLQCLRSVAEHTGSVPYEVIVVDNGSAEDEVENLKRGCADNSVRLIWLRQNRFFGEANNIGVETAAAEYVLLLNNDVTFTQSYLEALLAALQSCFRAGAAGPRFVFPDGRLQEAGSYVRPDGWTVQHGKTDSPNALIADAGPHIVDYCSAACLLLRRNVFLSIGGFDPLFEPAYFEDVDLCIRLRSIGLFTYYCGHVTVVHEEGVTASEVWNNKQRQAVITKNHRKFVLRWGRYLKERRETEVKPTSISRIDWQPGTIPTDAESTVHIRGAGLIQDTPSWRAILRIASMLNGRFHVVLVADEVCSRCRIYTFCKSMGLEFRNFSVRRFGADVANNKTTLVVFVADGSSAPNLSVTGPLKREVNELIRGVTSFT